MNHRHVDARTPLHIALLTVAAMSLACVARAVPDTVRVDNSKTCPGDGTTWATAYCSIQGALDSFTGGTNKIVAVQYTGTNYFEPNGVTIPAPDSGSVSQPLVLKALNGTVTIDCSDQASVFVQDTGDLWYALVSGPDSCNMVFMPTENNLRYPSCNGCLSPSALAVGQSRYFGHTDRVYIRGYDPNRDYGNDSGRLCMRSGIRVRASNVIIDGFKVRGTTEDAITIDGDVVDPVGDRLRYVTIQNCVVQESRGQGISVEDARLVTLKNNQSLRNIENGIYIKSRASDPDSPPVEECTITGNICFENDDHSQAGTLGSANGIRIGSQVAIGGKHVLQGNKCYQNEDSGFEVNGGDNNVFRYNQSWANGDHGFDHLLTTGITHVGDLAYGNNADGFSFENTSSTATMFNCIMADNGRSLVRQDYELEVLGSAANTFTSNNNLFYRAGRSTATCSDGSGHTWDEAADSILIAWKATDLQSNCRVRCDVDSTCFETAARFASHSGVNPDGNESRAKQGNPIFVDAAAANFSLTTSSPGIDAADTTATGWQTKDVLGFKRYDCRLVTNTGQPATTFADIGPYEHDDGAPFIEAVVEYDEASIYWQARGATGDTGPPPAYHEVYVNDIKQNVNVSPNPGTGVEETVSLLLCATSTVYVMTVDSDSVRAKSNTLTLQTCCGQGCYGTGPGGPSQTRASREEGDYRFELVSLGPNPARGNVRVGWSIPRAQAGSVYELDLFDVAGRRVSTVSNGVAKAGKFTHELSFRSGNGGQLPNGVFFLRLRVGQEVLRRTIVLTK